LRITSGRATPSNALRIHPLARLVQVTGRVGITHGAGGTANTIRGARICAAAATHPTIASAAPSAACGTPILAAAILAAAILAAAILAAAIRTDLTSTAGP
jgi:hypothetical protein